MKLIRFSQRTHNPREKKKKTYSEEGLSLGFIRFKKKDVFCLNLEFMC